MNPNLLWKIGSGFVATGVITGAFGAHALSTRLSPESLNSFRTASSYSIFNGLALLIISTHPRFSVHRFAGPAIVAGATAFSGSIFALVLNRDLKFLGPVTPLGGLLMISGSVADDAKRPTFLTLHSYVSMIF
ncbi:DUF423-domain-containing protein [Mycena indigotica]|uniref:DUF423-domain-containing protein n=1 Tax=Mycena indigotica TaxID=2126181 RepID=A0A8H6SYB0_9AGAR|nr:DUF423-domain-containing protein [Mycena indigotica]KAF7307012.1 DUF423-domain-containing protein [Mycena indigotica]